MNEDGLVRVEEVMTDRFALVNGLNTVSEALKVTRDRHVEALIVEKRHDHDEFGLVLLSDIAKQVIAKDRSPARVNLYEIMAKPVISVLPDMDVRYCARLFERFGINQAPVIEDNKVMGVVSYTDIVMRGIVHREHEKESKESKESS